MGGRVPTSGGKSIDSLTANEFGVELEGERVEGIFRVSGFAPFKLDIKSAASPKAIRDQFELVKMVQRDPTLAFNRWLRETAEARTDIVRPQRTLAILALDEGQEIRRWTIKGAWISEVKYSDFNTASGELVEETLTIQWEEIEQTWPGA
jgi:hypothetical protein